jgi:hypothetical protein
LEPSQSKHSAAVLKEGYAASTVSSLGSPPSKDHSEQCSWIADAKYYTVEEQLTRIVRASSFNIRQRTLAASTSASSNSEDSDAEYTCRITSAQTAPHVQLAAQAELQRQTVRKAARAANKGGANASDPAAKAVPELNVNGKRQRS